MPVYNKTWINSIPLGGDGASGRASALPGSAMYREHDTQNSPPLSPWFGLIVCVTDMVPKVTSQWKPSTQCSTRSVLKKRLLSAFWALSPASDRQGAGVKSADVAGGEDFVCEGSCQPAVVWHPVSTHGSRWRGFYDMSVKRAGWVRCGRRCGRAGITDVRVHDLRHNFVSAVGA